SHFMSLIGFWGLVYFYPLNGIHHYTFSPIPMHAQTSAIAASVAMGLTVVIVVTNLYASLRGSARMVVTYLPLRFVWLSLLFYILVSLQGAYQAGMPVQEVIHFTDWVIAHSHMAMAGFATFMVFGGILHFWPMVSGRVPDPTLRSEERRVGKECGAPWLTRKKKSRRMERGDRRKSERRMRRCG